MPFTREGYVSPDAAPYRAPGCTCSDPQLELVGCDCVDREPAVFVIHRARTGEWAGFRFPKRSALERPDAREWPTRQEAVNALAEWRASSELMRGALIGFEVVEG